MVGCVRSDCQRQRAPPLESDRARASAFQAHCVGRVARGTRCRARDGQVLRLSDSAMAIESGAAFSGNRSPRVT